MSTHAGKPKSSAERVAAYRARMRAKGFVQRTLWTWDTRSPVFIAEAQRQSQAVAANDPAGDDWMAFLDEGGRDWPTI